MLTPTTLNTTQARSLPGRPRLARALTRAAAAMGLLAALSGCAGTPEKATTGPSGYAQQFCVAEQRRIDLVNSPGGAVQPVTRLVCTEWAIGPSAAQRAAFTGAKP